MLLLVDAGNTRIKWALAAGDASAGQWRSSGSVVKDQMENLVEPWSKLTFSRVLLSNVAGEVVRGSLEKVLQSVAPGIVLEWQVSLPALAGIRNAYRQPQQLGTDRFISAIGARAMFPGTGLLVATCGTATTIDAISADGVFQGGLILPGLNLMAASLARNTANLPQVQLQDERHRLFADNTEEAIISGCMAAQTGAIEHAWHNFLSDHEGGPVQCLISGGAGAIVAAHLAIPHRHVDNLVLPGLQSVATLTPPNLN